MQPDQKLQQAIENLYLVFSIYPAPSTLDASPLRDPVNILRDLTSTSLRLLPPENLVLYSGAAMTTVGNVSDYKHFLPRIMELAIGGEQIDPGMIALKLRYGDWNDWPRNEQEGLVDIFSFCAIQAAQEHPDNLMAEAWLCSSATIGLDIRDILQSWQQRMSANVVLQVSTLLLDTNLFAASADERAYWENVDEATHLFVQNWLLDESRREELEAARSSISPNDLWLLDKAIERHHELITQRRQ